MRAPRLAPIALLAACAALLGGRAFGPVARAADAVAAPAESLSLVQTTPALPEGRRELFEAANAAYVAGDYPRAVELYTALVDRGVDAGSVLYNLGNAHHKAGDLGRAILAYERAQRKLPRSADLRENLGFLRILSKDRVEGGDGGRAVQLLDRAVHAVSADEAAWCVLALWLLTGAIATARVLTRSGPARRRLGRAMAVSGVLLGLGLTHAALLVRERTTPHCIVLDPEVAVRSGPGREYVTEFELHAGTRAVVRKRAGDWVQVALSEELRGWCPAAAVEEI